MVWLPEDNLFTAMFVWQDSALVQVLFIVPSMAIVIFAMPLASEAVTRIDMLPFVGTVDPSAGVVMVTSGSTVSLGDGVGEALDVGAVVGAGVTDAVGVGVGRGLTVTVLPAEVTVKSVVSAATICDAEARETLVVILGDVVLAPNWRVASWNVPVGGVWMWSGSNPTTRVNFPVVLALVMVVCCMILPHVEVVSIAS